MPLLTRLKSPPRTLVKTRSSSSDGVKRWFRHFQETQASVNDNGKEGGRGSRRAQQPSSSQPQEHDPDTQPQPERDGGEDSLDDSEAADSGEGPTTPGTSVNNNNNATDSPQDSFAKKTDSNDVSASNSTASGAGASAGRAGGGSARRLQEVQIIQIVEDTPLISPSEVTVSQGVVLSAQPVLTPIGNRGRSFGGATQSPSGGTRANLQWMK